MTESHIAGFLATQIIITQHFMFVNIFLKIFLALFFKSDFIAVGYGVTLCRGILL